MKRLLINIGFLSLLWLISCAGEDESDNYWFMEEFDISADKSFQEMFSEDGQYAVFYFDELLFEWNLVKKRTFSINDSTFYGLIAKLPLSDGRIERFHVWESSVVSEQLAPLYTDIKTYAGQGIDDPTATTRFELTSDGLSGIIITSEGSHYFSGLKDTDRYISFNKPSLIRRELFRELNIGDTTSVDTTTIKRIEVNQKTGLVSSRRLRLAIAGTTEYTNYFGNQFKAYENVIKAVQRANAIYERDFALTFELVTGDQMMFETKDTYDNDDIQQMVDENQNVMDSLVRIENYDIGHVFGTGNGGKGELPSACIDDKKAMGATGLSVPTGERFFVDYFVHELGHQLGANHTFSGKLGWCGKGALNAQTAYEPGSGSTIMGYASLCDQDNVQAYSDDYFHYASITEIEAHLARMDSGGCGQITEIGNNYPIVELRSPSYLIPKETPYILEAQVRDPDGIDKTSLTWEQYDLYRPLVRSIKPIPKNERNIPDLNFLVKGKNYRWERLPKTNRILNYVATARDNRSGFGGVNSAALKIQVIKRAGPFEIKRPNRLSSGNIGSPLEIRWDAQDTDEDPINCTLLDAYLSLDGGDNFELISTGINNTNERAIINLPLQTSDSAVILLRCANNIFFSVSEKFKITQ